MSNNKEKKCIFVDMGISYVLKTYISLSVAAGRVAGSTCLCVHVFMRVYLHE